MGRLKDVGQAWQRENKQNCKHSCKSGLLVLVFNGYLHLSYIICKICKAVLTMSGFGLFSWLKGFRIINVISIPVDSTVLIRVSDFLELR